MSLIERIFYSLFPSFNIFFWISKGDKKGMMSRRDRRNLSLRIHAIAKQFQDDLRKVFSAFDQSGHSGLSEWDMIGRFSTFLKNKGHTIAPATIRDYLYRDIFPAWLNPFLCEFLSQEPYLNSPVVWRFVRDWFKPTSLIVSKVKDRVDLEKRNFEKKIQEFDTW